MARAGLSPASLGSARRAALFRALARLEDAGLPADRVIAAMSELLGPRHAGRFLSMSSALAGGASMGEAGRRAGLWTVRERALIGLAERGGTLGRAAAALADGYEFRARILARLRGRMLLPLFVLTLGLLFAPLPGLVGGDLGAGEYVGRALGPLAALAVLVWAGGGLLRRVAARGLPPVAGAAAAVVPVLGPALVRFSRLELVEGLCLLLSAGVPTKEALEAALGALTVPGAGKRYAPALRRLEHEGLSQALHGVGALDRESFALAMAAERAGRLTDGLERVAGRLREGLESRLELAAEWLPRAVYAALLAVLAVGVLG